ncbi:MAG: hypothetical protein DMG71_18850, partial [Acidobacteria bacterium]
MRQRISVFVITAAISSTFLLALAALAESAPDYHLVKTYKLGGEGGWDYLTLDPDARRLYISRATHVIVLNVDSGKPVGDIPDTPGVHGIALAPGLGRGFTSNGREGTVSIFDLKTLKTLSKVKVGDNPDAILYDAATKRVFTFNGKSDDATAIDAEKGTVVGTIKLEGKPEFAVTDEKGGVFVNLEDKSQLLALDPAKLAVKSRWPLAPCEEPSGLAMDRKNRRLFAGCDNKVMAVVDADSGKVITTLPIGGGVDATAYDDETKLAFASRRCADGGARGISRQVQRGRECQDRAEGPHHGPRSEDPSGLSGHREIRASARAHGRPATSATAGLARFICRAGDGEINLPFRYWKSGPFESQANYPFYCQTASELGPAMPEMQVKSAVGRQAARIGRAIVLLVMAMTLAQLCAGYSVLTHEQIIDLLWKDQIQPLLLKRFPNATEEDLRKAHAYAYGGSVVQDMGYYPFGSAYF